MKLFDTKIIREIMPYTTEEIEAELKAGNWHIGGQWKDYKPGDKDEGRFGAPDMMPLAITYARKKYPDKFRETGIFATLVEGFATGMFGGFGQDQDPLYEKAEEAILALAGGVPASINDPEKKMFGLTPPVGAENLPPLLSKAEFTRAGIQLLENICFRSQETALEEALKYLSESITLQEKSRHAFKSKSIDRSRELVERAQAILRKLLK